MRAQMTRLLAAGLIAIATVGRAQQPQSTGPLPSATGLIAGQVLDPDTKKPVSEVLVALRIGAEAVLSGPRVLTDADGRFVFINVPSGNYGIFSEKFGYLGGQFGQRVYRGTARTLDLTDGQIVTDAIVPIWKEAALGGTVVDEAGDPLVGVLVNVYRRTVIRGQIQLERYGGTVTEATTDDRGMYRFQGLPPGQYAVAVPAFTATFPVEIFSGFGSGRMPTQAFRALSEIGPLGSARNQQIGTSVVMVGNRGVIPPPSAGERLPLVYRTTFAPSTLRPAEAAIVALSSGAERSDINVTLRPVRAVSVSGQLLGPAGPLQQTAVLFYAAGDMQSATVSYESQAAGGLTDSTGRFTILGVPEGDYFVSMYNQDQNGMQNVFQPLHVGGADINNLTLTVQAGTRLTGRFDLHGAKPPAALNTLFVSLDPVVPGAPSGSFVSGPDLRFSTLLAPGRYQFNRLYSPANLPCTAVLRNGKDIADEVLVVTDEPLDLTVVCGESATRLSGTVRKDDGSSDPDTAVVIFPVERQYWSGADFKPRRLVDALTDVSGRYSVVNVPPGDYFIAAIPIDRYDLWRDAKFLDVLARSATRITLAADESRAMDLRTSVVR